MVIGMGISQDSYFYLFKNCFYNVQPMYVSRETIFWCDFFYTLEYPSASFNVFSLYKNYLVFVLSISGFKFEVHWNSLKSEQINICLLS